MKRIFIVILYLISVFVLSACDDFTRNVDGEIYDTFCYKKSLNSNYTIVRSQNIGDEISDSDNEVIIGTYINVEYYFESETIYNYYLVEIPSKKGEYFPILEAIQKDEYVLEFIIDWCKNNWENEYDYDSSHLKSR